MANLAIRGHATRGKEVIEILEMLGGKISHECGYKDGFDSSYLFFINTNENFFIDGLAYNSEELKNYYIFTLEEFLEKFPYKVGDKVLYYGNPVFITQIEWIANSVSYHFYYNGKELMLPSKHLQPYKEETMKDYLVTEEDYGKTLEVEQEYIDAAERLMDQLAEGTHWKCKDFDSQKMIALFLKKNTSIITEKEDSIIVDIPKGYEFTGVDNQQVVFEKIGCKYPKTYEECCEVLSIPSYYKLKYSTYEHGYHEYTTSKKLGLLQDKLNTLGKLLICRDAYWKIYGERMGLGKSWEPDFTNNDEERYGIYTLSNKVEKDFCGVGDVNTILVFPTEEMRDAFLDSEEIAQLIENCKEFL